jgi:hypothetical protein
MLKMTNIDNSTNPTLFRVGDRVALAKALPFKEPMGVVVPAGEIGEVIDVDPDDTTQIMVQLFRYVHE